ncbi:MAG TPA: hypothetical protein VHT73_11985 [Thermodesulfobacteriota bacterium]|nr:hypothetical protein [Thermodesulfobacteriota bacterium]
MRSIEKRISELEQCISHIKQEKPLEPIGIILGCGPEAFVDWFDSFLHSSSKWHTFSFQERYDAVFQFCYKPGDTLPEYADSLAVELYDVIIETVRAEKRVREAVGSHFTHEEYYRAWQSEEGTLRDRLEMLHRYRS